MHLLESVLAAKYQTTVLDALPGHISLACVVIGKAIGRDKAEQCLREANKLRVAAKRPVGKEL